jgi:hypothetical protein
LRQSIPALSIRTAGVYGRNLLDRKRAIVDRNFVQQTEKNLLVLESSSPMMTFASEAMMQFRAGIRGHDRSVKKDQLLARGGIVGHRNVAPVICWDRAAADSNCQ